MGPNWMQEMRTLLFGGPSQEDQWEQIHTLQFLTAQPVLVKSSLEEKSNPLTTFLVRLDGVVEESKTRKISSRPCPLFNQLLLWDSTKTEDPTGLLLAQGIVNLVAVLLAQDHLFISR